jgi:hypothetical protein
MQQYDGLKYSDDRVNGGVKTGHVAA